MMLPGALTQLSVELNAESRDTAFQWKERWSFQQMVPESVNIHQGEKTNFSLNPTTKTKGNSRIMNLNEKCKNMKTLEKSMRNLGI